MRSPPPPDALSPSSSTRDEEIQNKLREEALSPGDPWGVIRYDPPGQNESSWIFKGIPKDQCGLDYDCRDANDAGKVHTCCDYCEMYFNKYCETTKEAVFQVGPRHFCGAVQTIAQTNEQQSCF